jgi:hypothetical protein
LPQAQDEEQEELAPKPEEPLSPPPIPEPLDLAKCWLGGGQGSVSGPHTPSAELLRRGAELAKAAVAQDSIHNYSSAIDLYTQLLAYFDTYVKHEDDSCTQELIMSKVSACSAFSAPQVVQHDPCILPCLLPLLGASPNFP